VSDAGPRVHPCAEGVEGAVVRGYGTCGKSDSSTEELAAWVEMRYSITARPARDGNIPAMATLLGETVGVRAEALPQPIPGYSTSLTAASMQRTGFAERSLKKS
jgi:hypothetical protein